MSSLDFVNRFENVKFLQKVENVPVRRALVSAFIMIVSMGISFVGLTNVVKYGYGYCGYLGIAIIIVPLLTIGFYKNRKFMKENSQDAKVSFEEAYEKKLDGKSISRLYFFHFLIKCLTNLGTL